MKKLNQQEIKNVKMDVFFELLYLSENYNNNIIDDKLQEIQHLYCNNNINDVISFCSEYVKLSQQKLVPNNNLINKYYEYLTK